MLWTDTNLLWENPKKQYGKMLKKQTPTDNNIGWKKNMEATNLKHFSLLLFASSVTTVSLRKELSLKVHLDNSKWTREILLWGESLLYN